MSNLVDVTRDEFFAALHADKRDIMPTIVSGWSEGDGYVSEWRTKHGDTLFGKTWGRLGNERYQLVRP